MLYLCRLCLLGVEHSFVSLKKNIASDVVGKLKPADEGMILTFSYCDSVTVILKEACEKLGASSRLNSLTCVAFPCCYYQFIDQMERKGKELYLSD